MHLMSKYDEFKSQFNVYFQHTKKVKALENYGEVANYSGAKYIRILKELIKDGFLEPEESVFLDFQIKKAEINYLFWSHKTKTLKKEMRRIAATKVHLVPPKQLYLDINKARPLPINMPINMTITMTGSKEVRI